MASRKKQPTGKGARRKPTKRRTHPARRLFGGKAQRVYRAAPGARYSQQDAQIIGRELEKLGDQVTPQQLVAAAEPETSALHRFFLWNTRQAAHAYRLSQARHILNHLEITIVKDDRSDTLKAFHNIQVINEDEDKETQYASLGYLQTNEEAASQIVLRAKAEAKAWRRRYSAYKSYFARIFAAIDAL